jgi:hypothetical protein
MIPSSYCRFTRHYLILDDGQGYLLDDDSRRRPEQRLQGFRYIPLWSAVRLVPHGRQRPKPSKTNFQPEYFTARLAFPALGRSGVGALSCVAFGEVTLLARLGMDSMGAHEVPCGSIGFHFQRGAAFLFPIDFLGR